MLTLGALVGAVSVTLADNPIATAIGVAVGVLAVGLFAILAGFLSARQLEKDPPTAVAVPPAHTDREAMVSGVRVGALSAAGGLVAGGGALLLFGESDLSVLVPVIAGLGFFPYANSRSMRRHEDQHAMTLCTVLDGPRFAWTSKQARAALVGSKTEPTSRGRDRL